MSRAVRKHKFWLICLCTLIAGVLSLYGWQLHAQDVDEFGNPLSPTGQPMGPPGMEGPPGGMGAPPGGMGAPPGGLTGPPGTPGAPAAAAAAPTVAPAPSEPVFSLSTLLPQDVRVMKIKNWDGMVTELLRFKYKTLDGKVITVHLPVVYKEEQKTKAAWDTLFRVFAMDYEAQLDAMERENPPDVSAYMGQLMAEIRGQVPGTGFDLAAVAPALRAQDYARSQLPAMGMQLPPMPTALPGMF